MCRQSVLKETSPDSAVLMSENSSEFYQGGCDLLSCVEYKQQPHKDGCFGTVHILSSEFMILRLSGCNKLE